MDECLRLWPPAVGVLLRTTRKDIKIGPYEIPKGMLVGTNIIGLMHNPKYYKDPEVFYPDRWNDKSLYNSEPYSFIPFSAGNRSCIGKYLALMETKLMLIGFLTNFNISRTDVPLRMHAKFLYEPVDENLVLLKEGGIKLWE